MLGGVGGKSLVRPGESPATSHPLAPQPSGGRTFDEVLRQTTPGPFDLQVHSELLQVERAVAGGKGVPLADLINIQIKAGQFGLRVELLSKVAESATTTLRKLQSGQ